MIESEPPALRPALAPEIPVCVERVAGAGKAQPELDLGQPEEQRCMERPRGTDRGHPIERNLVPGHVIDGDRTTELPVGHSADSAPPPIETAAGDAYPRGHGITSEHGLAEPFELREHRRVRHGVVVVQHDDPVAIVRPVQRPPHPRRHAAGEADVLLHLEVLDRPGDCGSARDGGTRLG